MKDILIATYDMEVGGVERSLISMADNFDYKKYKVDLMLYRHRGDFLNLVSNKINLLDEIPQYASFRKSIKEILKEREYRICLARLMSRVNANFMGKKNKIAEPGYLQMQLMWKYTLPFLPRAEKDYDVAISYLWPHYFVAEKVNARKKIAWIHTDFSTVGTDVKIDLEMWSKYDHIIAVSEACRDSFLKKYAILKDKVQVLENITSPAFIKKMANEHVDNPMINDCRFKIITVARLSHAKGIDNAVRALKLIKDKGHNNVAWYVVGYGGDETMIRNLIKEYRLENNFFLLGKKTNPYPFIKESDLYVQPSRYEGKAVTVTEAQILAKPVLITNYTTASSQIQDGVDGIICDLSVEGIASGIENLLRNHEIGTNLVNNIKDKNYSNSFELEKLYRLLG